MIKRIFKYLFLGGLTIVTPYAIVMVFIVVTMDRVGGMELGILPGVILPQFLFGLFFIEGTTKRKVILATIMTAMIIALFLIVGRFELIKTYFDLYGFWDIVLTNFIVGVIAWETFYHGDAGFKRRHSNRSELFLPEDSTTGDCD